MTVSVQLLVLSLSPRRINKIFGSYFLVFGKCGVTPHRFCRGSLTLTYKNKVKLRSGTAKRKKTSILDIEENAEIEKVIRLSRRFAPKGANIENLEKLLLRNLRIVDWATVIVFSVPCHIDFRWCGKLSDQVLRNPEIYTLRPLRKVF